VTWIRELAGDRLAVFVGVDDAIVEAIAVGAVGWVAGLVNGYQRVRRSFQLRDERRARKSDRVIQLVFPLLRMDTVPKFVQLIKLVQQEVEWGMLVCVHHAWNLQAQS
jgi:4-hydroxy-tetrahydrodipicolinate synthase